MDPDGSNQKQITRFRSISIEPAVSPDGSKIAFTSFAKGNPAIFVFSVETGRALPFYNQMASLNATPNFTPDGKHIVYSSTAAGGRRSALHREFGRHRFQTDHVSAAPSWWSRK